MASKMQNIALDYKELGVHLFEKKITAPQANNHLTHGLFPLSFKWPWHWIKLYTGYIMHCVLRDIVYLIPHSKFKRYDVWGNQNIVFMCNNEILHLIFHYLVFAMTAFTNLMCNVTVGLNPGHVNAFSIWNEELFERNSRYITGRFPFLREIGLQAKATHTRTHAHVLIHTIMAASVDFAFGKG